MRKKIIVIIMTCSLAMNAEAQIYAGDTWMQMPTADLYDMGMMNAYARASAEMAARREAYYDRCSNMAVEAWKNKQWNAVIYYVNEALSMKFYSGHIYYLRGYAYEQLGNLRAAKKDYKKGKKNYSSEAARALEALKARQRQKK